MRVLAHLISWLFIPLLMPIYGVAITLFVPSFEASFLQQNTLFWLDVNYKIVVFLWFLLFSFVAPGISLLLMRLSKNISSIEVENQHERNVPISISAMFCLVLALLLMFKAPDNVLPKTVYALPWGGFISLVIAGILNRKDKISLHALGCGMLMGFFIAYYSKQIEYQFSIIILGFIVSGLVMSARIYLEKHNLSQVLKGFGLGFVVLFLTINFYSIFL